MPSVRASRRPLRMPCRSRRSRQRSRCRSRCSRCCRAPPPWVRGSRSCLRCRCTCHRRSWPGNGTPSNVHCGALRRRTGARHHQGGGAGGTVGGGRDARHACRPDGQPASGNAGRNAIRRGIARALPRSRRTRKHFPGWRRVESDVAWVERLDALVRAGEWAAGWLAGLLAIAVVAATFNTVRLQVLTRAKELEVSSLLGGTRPWLRRPFLYFGTLQGLLAGALAVAGVAVALAIFAGRLGPASGGSRAAARRTAPSMAARRHDLADIRIARVAWCMAGGRASSGRRDVPRLIAAKAAGINPTGIVGNFPGRLALLYLEC